MNLHALGHAGRRGGTHEGPLEPGTHNAGVGGSSPPAATVATFHQNPEKQRAALFRGPTTVFMWSSAYAFTYTPCGMSAPDHNPLTRPPGRAPVESRRAWPASWGWHGLGAFWGSVAMVFGSGALVLQLLGPPPDRPPARRDAASPPEPNAAEAASNARPEMATEKYQDVVAGLLSSGRVSDASAPEPSQVLSPAELADRGRVLRDANGAGNALPPASRDHSEPAAPVAPHEGPERPLVSADHSSAEPASSVAPPPNAAPPAAPLAAGLLPAPSSSPPHTPAPSSAEFPAAAVTRRAPGASAAAAAF